MKLLLTILSGICFLNPAGISTQKWAVERSSNLSLDGKTNINNFHCEIPEYLRRDTVLLCRDAEKPISIKGGLTINIKHFDCHQKYITGDLRKTLKADEQSFFQINLINLGYFTKQPGKQRVKGLVDIELAGINRRMEIDYEVMVFDEANMVITGNHKVLFSDFRLTPPRKLAGLIKVEDEINVHFQLVMKLV